MDVHPDLTVIYYTANRISEHFASKTRQQLLLAKGDLPLISISRKKMRFGDNYAVGLPYHHLSIYRQALIGAELAKTKYIALAEDDVLYSPEHFKHRPKPGKFAYNMAAWNVYTWNELFSHKANGRINLNGLICERELFIEAMNERFLMYWVDSEINLSNWAEPGKYEKNLGVTIRETELFYTNPPNIVFSHEKELAYENLGRRKKLGEFRALEIPYWGTIEDMLKIYEEPK